MKILMASLQVSENGSKGHLHPALMLCLEAKARGHEVLLFPLPSRLSEEDRAQLSYLNIAYIEPPQFKQNIIKSTSELATLAKDPHTVHMAYESFLIDPLAYQYDYVAKMIERIDPDVVVFDLLVYLAPIIARKLLIREIGFCAGLKLIAPSHLQKFYKSVAEKISNKRQAFLDHVKCEAQFHHLELVSEEANLVFAPSGFLEISGIQHNVHCVGPLHPKKERGDIFSTNLTSSHYGLLSFGSALDPADYPQILKAAIDVTHHLNIELLVSSRKLSEITGKLPSHVKAYPYLPLTKLIKNARFYIHHGGASAFSESLFFSAKQILVPLTTDQPIQAHYLEKIGTGFVIHKEIFTYDRLLNAIACLMDPLHPIQSKIAQQADNYRSINGAKNAVDLIEGSRIHRHESKKSIPQIIMNVDDFGMKPSIDEAIISTIERNLIDSVSVSVINQLSHNHLNKLKKCINPNNIGLHVNLSEGTPLILDHSDIMVQNGSFREAIVSLRNEARLDCERLKREIDEQILAFTKIFGFMPSHMDCHQHFAYLSPHTFEAYLQCALTRKIPIRSPALFLDHKRLVLFLRRVEEKFAIQMPFSSTRLVREIRAILSRYPVQWRTKDCVLDDERDLEAIKNNPPKIGDVPSLEIVCHIHSS